MPETIKAILFIFTTIGLIWVSRGSLRDARQHGFYRFFAWEGILALFLLNVDDWFANPFHPRQILSWILLILSLALIFLGVQAFRKLGQIDPERQDPALVGIEKTTELVTSGVYHILRHPFYSSLLCLCWGILLKNVRFSTLALASAVTALLVITARIEERENLRFFGEIYRDYMRRTKRFIPFVF